MRKARILLILGIWVTMLPYLGFPYSWKGFLGTMTGLGLVYFSYVLYREVKEKETAENSTSAFDNFKENKDWSERSTTKEI